MAHDHVHGSNIEQCVIMVCTPDLYYQEFKIDGLNLRKAKHDFLRRLDQYHDIISDEKERAYNGAWNNTHSFDKKIRSWDRWCKCQDHNPFVYKQDHTRAHRYYWWDWQTLGQNWGCRVKDGNIAASLWHKLGKMDTIVSIATDFFKKYFFIFCKKMSNMCKKVNKTVKIRGHGGHFFEFLDIICGKYYYMRTFFWGFGHFYETQEKIQTCCD